MGWKEDQDAAIARQRAAHKAVHNGTEPVPAAEDGPLARYTRAQTLDYIAQLQKCLDDGQRLPNATGPGLTVLPGTERDALSDKDRDDYVELVAVLTAAGSYTEDEIADAIAELEENLAAGVSLDPATAENVA